MPRINHMGISSKLKYILVPVLLLLASISLTKTTLDIINSSKRLDELKKDISSLEQEKTELGKSIEYKNSDSYVEKIARDELNMVKPNERLFVVKTNRNESENKVVAPNVLSAATSKEKKELKISDRSENIQTWFKLFF